ncbi:hypothetical protein QR680_008816 [Steinernema hermaphroditum]|uniref:Uncharacterized protein n=1 Tax=Steinernema hermaphroditum TaxID=289476 RepID=A0AA39M8T1_9BILA|nr:hypothetical protein QR680_008816 [Steinernema hermaphroditum]
MGRRPKDLDVSSSEDRGIPKQDDECDGGCVDSNISSRRRGKLRGRKTKISKKEVKRPPCRSENFAYLDEVLTSSCKSDTEASPQPSAKESKKTSPKAKRSPLKKPQAAAQRQRTTNPKIPSPHRNKYVSLLDDEMVIDGLSAETSSRRSTEAASEVNTVPCTCTCNCKDCRKVREKRKATKDDSEIDEEQASELLTRVDKGKIAPVCPVDPVDDEGIRRTSSSKTLERFYSPNRAHLDEVLGSTMTGDFRLCPIEGNVPFSKLRRHRQTWKFVIYYKTFQGRYRRYNITEANVGQEVYYFVDCIDTEAPLFSCLYKLLKYYVDNSTYYSLQVEGFIRFPVGQVMKKGRFERHYADLLRK